MKILLAATPGEPLDRVTDQLEKEGFTVIAARDGADAVDRWHHDEPDLVVVDVTLPPAGGFQVCQHIRRASRTPVILIGSTTDEEAIVRSFSAGADDYVSRPAGSSQLALRIRAVHGRYARTTPFPVAAELPLGSLILNLESHELRHENTIVLLTPIEFRILSILAANEGMVVSFSRLIEYAWSHKSYNKANLDALKTHVTHVRRKLQQLGGQPSDIVVVPRSGYYLPRARK